MTYIPKKDKIVQNISLALILLGMAVFAISNYVSYGAIFQMVSLGIIVVGVQILVRYALSDFVYILDDKDDGNSDLVIIKKQGKREEKVCHLALSCVIDVVPKGEKKHDSQKRYSYVQNLGAKAYTLLFRDGDKTVEVLFEPDEVFVHALKERITSEDNTDGLHFAM